VSETASVDVTSDLYINIIHPGHKTSEDLITLSYTPQAVFRVRTVTRCTGTIAGHGAAILAAQFSPKSSTRVVTGSGDSTARIWDSFTSTPMFTLEGHTNWVLCVAWSPDAKVIATGSYDNTVLFTTRRSNRSCGYGIRKQARPKVKL
jgi:ribosome assembly protein 4